MQILAKKAEFECAACCGLTRRRVCREIISKKVTEWHFTVKKYHIYCVSVLQRLFKWWQHHKAILYQTRVQSSLIYMLNVIDLLTASLTVKQSLYPKRRWKWKHFALQGSFFISDSSDCVSSYSQKDYSAIPGLTLAVNNTAKHIKC